MPKEEAAFDLEVLLGNRATALLLLNRPQEALDDAEKAVRTQLRRTLHSSY